MTVAFINVVVRAIQAFMIVGALKVIFFSENHIIGIIFSVGLVASAVIGTVMTLALLLRRASVRCPICEQRIGIVLMDMITAECPECGVFVLEKTSSLGVKLVRRRDAPETSERPSGD